MTDTTTAAIIARCDHIEHCAMNHHHQDADRMRALVAERDQALAREHALLDSNQEARDFIRERDTLAKQTEDCARTCAEQAEELEGAYAIIATERAEVLKLRREVKEARNAALDEVIFLVRTWEQGAIEGGIFEQLIGWLTSRIRALKSEPAPRHLDDECQRCGSVGGFGCYECTPAPRQSVQEAARVLLNAPRSTTGPMAYAGRVAATFLEDVECGGEITTEIIEAFLRALAQEAQRDA